MVCRLNWKLPSDNPEFALRLGPLREHWEARGPGLLAFAQRQRAWLEVPECVDVVLVAPVGGGGGRIIASRQIELAAVLANPLPLLPEVTRLGWLILCLLVDDVKESIGLIPVVLEAAEHVELAQLNETSVKCALQHWATESEIGGPGLVEWWQDRGGRAASRSEWELALREL